MIRRAGDCPVEYREHMRDGEGTVKITNFITSPGDLNEKGRMFSRITLNPGCSIGYHVHEKDSEIFYFLTGKGIYSDNGEETEVSAGDVAFCPAGTGHSIRNAGTDVLEMVALIVYK